MDESEENLSAEDIQSVDSPVSVKIKPKKRSLVERELETNLTARVTSPATSEGSSTSRYGRARRLKNGTDTDIEKVMKPLKIDVSKTQPQAYKMHASNSPIRKESPKRAVSLGSSIENQIENIYNENISLSRFGSEEKAKSQSPAKKFSKVYIRKDLIQKPDTGTVVLIKNMFSPTKPNTHLNNILERSSEKYNLNGHGKPWNGFPDTSSVVKALDFDGKKKKKDAKEKVTSKNELFNLEASCEYQVGDLAWARVGTYPFWPCIVSREPFSDTFVKKKLFGRVERAVIHVTFFGDNGRRGWIVDNMLRQYRGRADFEAAREKFTMEDKKKDPRLYAAHFVSEKKMPLWNVSVEEAETLMKEPKRLRIDALYDMLEKSRAAKTTPKRERGGKISRTDSDVSLSESLYDTLFSEDDGKTDDNNRKARTKSLDVSEVVTACLDNMAAKSGIIQIQRQSHMDRWLQKAKSKTPEKMQPKLQIKLEKEKRRERVKKKSREGKKPNKLRKNESLGSDTNLLPYQNEHDYSSVNYENHNINDSSNLNTDSASGHDSTFDSSGIGVTVKIENISSSMEDCGQDDIITTVVNDDIVMTEPENSSKNVNDLTDINISNVENKNDHNLEISRTNENAQTETQVQSPVNSCDITNGVQPRRSKRKRQTSEGLNSSSTDNKAKEPKLDLPEPRTNIIVTAANTRTEMQENSQETTNKEPDSTEKEIDCTRPSISKLKQNQSHQRILNSKEFTSFNCLFKPVVVIEPLEMDGLEAQIIVHQSKQLVVTNVNETKDNLKSPDASSGMVQKEKVNKVFSSNVDSKSDANVDLLTDNENVEPKQSQNEFPKDVQQLAAESIIDSKQMEVVNSEIPDSKEKDKLANPTLSTIISEANKDSTAALQTDSKNRTAKVVVLPLVQESEETNIRNNATNVVIGEETYIFDRTLSQDYDEIDAFEGLNSSSTDNKAKEPKLDLPEPRTNIIVTAANTRTEMQENSQETTDKEPDSTEKEIDCTRPSISKLKQNQSHQRILNSKEFTSFNCLFKPVVVIEPLEMDGLEAQIIVHQSKQLVVTNVNETKDNLKSPDASSGMVQKEKVNKVFSSNVDSKSDANVDLLTDNENVEPKQSQNELPKDVQQLAAESIIDSKQMEVVNSEIPDSKEKDKLANPTLSTIISEANKDSTAALQTDSKNRTAKVVVLPLVQESEETNIRNNATNDVIGEETYIFDRTLSQDYDEIDAFEGLNSSSTDNKAKEPKLDLPEPRTNIIVTAANTRTEMQENSQETTDKEPDSTEKEIDCTRPSISKLKQNQSHQRILNSKEFTSFNCLFKPVVVIEPLKMDGLEAQIIVHQSKQLVVTNVNETKDNLKSPDASSGMVQKEKVNKIFSSNVDSKSDANVDLLTDNENVEPKQSQNELSKDVQQLAAESIIDSKQMEVVNSEIPDSKEKYKLANPTLSTIISEANKDTTAALQTDSKNRTAKVVVLPLVQESEETYIFDRTLSQDYDEIDANRCDEASNLPATSSLKESEDSNEVQNSSCGHKETKSEERCNVDSKNDDTESTEIAQTVDENVPVTDDCPSSNIFTNDINTLNVFELSKAPTNQREFNVSDLEDSCKKSNEDLKRETTSDTRHDCIFLDKENNGNNPKIITQEDNAVPSATSDVSSVTNEEQIKVSNQMTEENNSKCVFLDESIEKRDTPHNDSKEKKRKSPRLSLNRTKNRTSRLNKKDNEIEKLNTKSLGNSLDKVNTDTDIMDVETASIHYDDSEMSITRRKGRSKEKQDVKKAMNDPEFVKYLEIRQDALLDEQPDLTQDEIVTYLYQNWLYEEENKSEVKRTDDTEQFNLVKGLNEEVAHQPKKIRKKPKEKEPDLKNVDIRSMMQKEKPKLVPHECGTQSENLENDVHKSDNDKNDILDHGEVLVESKNDARSTDVNKSNDTDDCKSSKIHKINSIVDSKVSENLVSSTDEANNHENVDYIDQEKNDSENGVNSIDKPLNDTEIVNIPNDVENSKAETCADELRVVLKHGEFKKFSGRKKNGFIENKEVNLESKTNKEFDPETASIISEDSGVSIPRRRGRPKQNQDVKKAMDDPEFVKYLEARQDALIDEQPDLTQDEIVTYLYQTWFYEETNKSELKKTDDTEQSNLVKGLNQEPAPQPKKYRKKQKDEKEPELKNVDIRDMIKKEKPKRKTTQSKPYYNEDDSDLEEEDLETFKIFEKDEENEDGEEIDEVELYFEKLTKPKPNVFKGYVRERVCEICEIAGNLLKCKNCHGTFHVNCVKMEVEVTEVVSAPERRGRKKKKGRKTKGYDPILDSGSQSDERSQDANNSEELNMSIEEETGSHIVIDADNFESQWKLKMKELQSDNQEEYASDQEMNWEVQPGHCEIVDIKQKEKPIDYSDYKCNKCQKYDTPVCFVCKSNKSPKSLTEVRQKCQVAHCHRYYHLECLDHWPQTQFNSWEPSKTNKKVLEYIEALSCPRHVCHTCVSDDPRGCKTRFCGDKLARCVRCPATYHSYTRCLPAGTQILTGSQIICPRHYEHRPGKVPCHVNTGWCFICALGGTLICCEYCPTSFHAECLNIKPPEGSYMCEDCETGRLPLYGEMVWVKLGHYRWWPGIILHPTEIPENIMAVKHSLGEFVVRFFGQYDHYWVNRGRVFPFQEGDSGKISSQKSKIDAAFTTAMEHAQRACEILKKMEPNEEEDMEIASSLLPPHYVKLKVNKPAGVARREVDANSLTQCDCDPTQPDPCGPYSHCLNRMLLTECGPLCRAGERCNNRAFERRLYPRLAAYRTPQRGWGLRTLEDIRQGQFVIEYVGELIDLEEFRRRMCRKHEIRDENFYFLTLDKERMIDAGPKGNLARFMNHCCEPNCETQKWTVLGDVRVGLFALRDIPANSEVTFNYNLECAGIEKKRCLCGAKRCSGYIGAKPKQLQDDQPKKVKPPAKRTYKKRKPVEDSPTTSKTKVLKIKIKPIKPRELTEIEKDLLIIKNATNGMSSDSEGSRLSSVDEKNPKALKRKRVSFSTEDNVKKAKLTEDFENVAE